MKETIHHTRRIPAEVEHQNYFIRLQSESTMKDISELYHFSAKIIKKVKLQVKPSTIHKYIKKEPPSEWISKEDSKDIKLQF
jgi:hypothetical protein